jgi:hypothetical protein
MNWFKWPWALTAILLLPYVAWRLRGFRHHTPAILFPRVADDAPRSLRQRWIQLPNILRLIALAVLIAAGAGPVWDQRPSRQIANSIGIQILVDRSSSMASADMIYEGRQQSRLDVVKRISHDFIFGEGHDLRGVVGMLPGSCAAIAVVIDGLLEPWSGIAVPVGTGKGSSMML